MYVFIYIHIHFLGGMMLFCIWDRNISHRQKVGILIGVTFQMFSSVLQVFFNRIYVFICIFKYVYTYMYTCIYICM
jgi:hypothetical protein